MDDVGLWLVVVALFSAAVGVGLAYAMHSITALQRKVEKIPMESFTSPGQMADGGAAVASPESGATAVLVSGSGNGHTQTFRQLNKHQQKDGDDEQPHDGLLHLTANSLAALEAKLLPDDRLLPPGGTTAASSSSPQAAVTASVASSLLSRIKRLEQDVADVQAELHKSQHMSSQQSEQVERLWAWWQSAVAANPNHPHPPGGGSGGNGGADSSSNATPGRVSRVLADVMQELAQKGRAVAAFDGDASPASGGRNIESKREEHRPQPLSRIVASVMQQQHHQQSVLAPSTPTPSLLSGRRGRGGLGVEEENTTAIASTANSSMLVMGLSPIHRHHADHTHHHSTAAATNPVDSTSQHPPPVAVFQYLEFPENTTGLPSDDVPPVSKCTNFQPRRLCVSVDHRGEVCLQLCSVNATATAPANQAGEVLWSGALRHVVKVVYVALDHDERRGGGRDAAAAAVVVMVLKCNSPQQQVGALPGSPLLMASPMGTSSSSRLRKGSRIAALVGGSTTRSDTVGSGSSSRLVLTAMQGDADVDALIEFLVAVAPDVVQLNYRRTAKQTLASRSGKHANDLL